MPEFYIREAFDNNSPDELFERVGYSGDHSKTIALVQAGIYGPHPTTLTTTGL